MSDILITHCALKINLSTFISNFLFFLQEENLKKNFHFLKVSNDGRLWFQTGLISFALVSDFLKNFWSMDGETFFNRKWRKKKVCDRHFWFFSNGNVFLPELSSTCKFINTFSFFTAHKHSLASLSSKLTLF